MHQHGIQRLQFFFYRCKPSNVICEIFISSKFYAQDELQENFESFGEQVIHEQKKKKKKFLYVRHLLLEKMGILLPYTLNSLSILLCPQITIQRNQTVTCF